MNTFLKHIWSKWKIAFKEFKKAKSCITPIITYSIAVWGKIIHCTKLDQILFRAQRYFTGTPKRTRSIGLR